MGQARARIWTIGLLLVGTALLGPRGAAADDQPELEFCAFHVGALTSGLPWHYGEAPAPVEAQEVSYEPSLLFGGMAEESFYPVGQADELIEIVKSFVQPEVWEEVAGAYLASQNERLLFARAPRETLEKVGRFLADLEQRTLRSVRVDLRALPEPEGLPAPDSLEGLRGRAARGDGRALTLVGIDRQHIAGTSGAQAAYVAGYDGSVAQGAATSAPVVEVANLGLIASAQVTLGAAGGRATLRAQVHLVDLDALDARDAGEGRRLEALSVRRTSACGTFDLPVGSWERIGAGNGWTLLARVQVATHRGTPRLPPSLRMAPEPGGEPVARMIDVGDFTATRPSRLSGHAFLTPTGYTPPEPPELAEPCAPFPSENLVELLLSAAPQTTWHEPATVEARNGVLLVRNGEGAIREVERVLGVLRREILETFELQVEVLEVPPPVAQALAAAGEASAVPERARAALTAARMEGAVRVLAATQLRVAPPASAASHAGTVRRYVGGFSEMIAQESHIARPITFDLREGLFLTVTAELLSTGDAAHVQLLECQRAEAQPKLRTCTTPSGTVELPWLKVLRMRGGFVAPLDQPVLVTAAEGGQVVLATLRREARR